MPRFESWRGRERDVRGRLDRYGVARGLDRSNYPRAVHDVVVVDHVDRSAVDIHVGLRYAGDRVQGTLDRRFAMPARHVWDPEGFLHEAAKANLAAREGGALQIGMVGLGRMGGNMVTRLLRGGHEVVGYALDPQEVSAAVAAGAVGASSLDELVSKLDAPRVVWLMVPAGGPTSDTVAALSELLSPGDVVIDGGNSRYTDSIERGVALKELGIDFVDAGTSGGVWGLEEGYCLMLGAEPEVFERLVPILETLAPPDGFARVGPVGTGHFTKMVHNGIEYGLMQSYAEGFDLLRSADLDLDTAQVAELWRHGSVVRSWLLDLAAKALAEDPTLAGVAPYVEDSGEGRWTLETAIDHAVPMPAIAAALFARFSSRRDDPFSARMLAALRREFGGHGVHTDTHE